MISICTHKHTCDENTNADLLWESKQLNKKLVFGHTKPHSKVAAMRKYTDKQALRENQGGTLKMHIKNFLSTWPMREKGPFLRRGSVLPAAIMIGKIS